QIAKSAGGRFSRGCDHFNKRSSNEVAYARFCAVQGDGGLGSAQPRRTNHRALFSVFLFKLLENAWYQRRAGAAFGADGAALWAQNCASCHGKDGSGNTTMGKKLGVKDYTKSQSFSDAEAANVIKNGKGKMKGYKDKLSDPDVKALVAYVRTLKK